MYGEEVEVRVHQLVAEVERAVINLYPARRVPRYVAVGEVARAVHPYERGGRVRRGSALVILTVDRPASGPKGYAPALRLIPVYAVKAAHYVERAVYRVLVAQPDEARRYHAAVYRGVVLEGFLEVLVAGHLAADVLYAGQQLRLNVLVGLLDGCVEGLQPVVRRSVQRVDLGLAAFGHRAAGHHAPYLAYEGRHRAGGSLVGRVQGLPLRAAGVQQRVRRQRLIRGADPLQRALEAVDVFLHCRGFSPVHHAVGESLVGEAAHAVDGVLRVGYGVIDPPYRVGKLLGLQGKLFRGQGPKVILDGLVGGFHGLVIRGDRIVEAGYGRFRGLPLVRRYRIVAAYDGIHRTNERPTGFRHRRISRLQAVLRVGASKVPVVYKAVVSALDALEGFLHRIDVLGEAVLLRRSEYAVLERRPDVVPEAAYRVLRLLRRRQCAAGRRGGFLRLVQRLVGESLQRVLDGLVRQLNGLVVLFQRLAERIIRRVDVRAFLGRGHVVIYGLVDDAHQRRYPVRQGVVCALEARLGIPREEGVAVKRLERALGATPCLVDRIDVLFDGYLLGVVDYAVLEGTVNVVVEVGYGALHLTGLAQGFGGRRGGILRLVQRLVGESLQRVLDGLVRQLNGLVVLFQRLAERIIRRVDVRAFLGRGHVVIYGLVDDAHQRRYPVRQGVVCALEARLGIPREEGVAVKRLERALGATPCLVDRIDVLFDGYLLGVVDYAVLEGAVNVVVKVGYGTLHLTGLAQGFGGLLLGPGGFGVGFFGQFLRGVGYCAQRRRALRVVRRLPFGEVIRYGYVLGRRCREPGKPLPVTVVGGVVCGRFSQRI